MPERYWRGASGEIWNNISGSKWADSPTAPVGATAPTVLDDVFFDTTSGSTTVITASNATCKSVNFTGFSGIFEMGTNWTVVNDVRLSSSMSLTGSGTLIKTGSTGSWTSNGLTFSGSIQTPNGGGFDTIFVDDWNILGSLVGTPNLVDIISGSGIRTLSIGGSLNSAAGYNCTNVNFLLNGTGTVSGFYNSTTITMNTGGTIFHGSSITLANSNFTYVAGMFSATGGTLTIGGVAGCSLNNVDSISFKNLLFATSLGQTLNLNSEAYFTGNLSTVTVAGTINGSDLHLSGNISLLTSISGTSEIIMEGASDSSVSSTGGSLLNNLTINKSSGATVSLGSNITWGGNNNTFSMNTSFFPNNFTLTLSGTPVTINNSSISDLYRLTIPNLTTVIINDFINVTESINLLGTCTFNGNSGWNTSALHCTAAGSVITFEAGETYNVSNFMEIVGTLTNRIVLQSSSRVAFNGSANGLGLTFSSGTPPSTGMILSQASGAAPLGFANLFPSRPIITGGTSPNFTLNSNINPTTGLIAMEAGNPAFLNMNNTGSYSVGLVTTKDINSSGGQTILAFLSDNDNIGNSNIFLYRTVNWGPLEPPTRSPAWVFFT